MQKEAIAPGGITLFVVLGYAAINSFLLVYAEEKNTLLVAHYFFTVYAVTLLLSRPLVGRLTDKYGSVRIATPFLFMTVVSLLFNWV